MSTQTSNSEKGGTPRSARMVFGIVMVLIYIVVGILLICKQWAWLAENNPTVSICLGILLVAYGIWRAIRLFKGWN